MTTVTYDAAWTVAPRAEASATWTTVRRALGVAAVYTLTYLAVFSPVLARGNLLAPGDGVIVFLAGFRSARWAWDPTMFAGFPGLADPQRMSWYPPALAASLLPDGWNALVLSGYVLASCFTYAYVRKLTGSSLGAGVAGLVYGLSGFLIAHLGHVNLVHTSAWLPMVLYSFEKLRARAAPAWIATAALGLACSVLAAHPQISAYTIMYLGPYAVVAAARAPAGRWRYCGAAMTAVVLGLALSAILLLPLHQLTKGSLRSDVDYATFTSFNLPLGQLSQMIFPYAFGDGRYLAYAGAGNITETTGYMGLLPLLLAGLGACSAAGQRTVRFWLAAGACALVLSLGADGGLSALLYHVPVLNKFRCPARHLGELSLAVAVLAGWGAASLGSLPKPQRIRLAQVASLIPMVAFGVAAWGLSHWVQGHPEMAIHFTWKSWAIAMPLSACVVGLAVFWWNAVKPTKLAGGVLLATVALELGTTAQWADWSWQSVEEPVLACPEVLAKYRDEFLSTGQRLTGLLSSPWTPVDAALANLPALWKLPTTGGYNPLAPQRLAEFLHLDRSGNGFASYRALEDTDRALDLLASRYVIAPNNLIVSDSPLYKPEAERLLTASDRFRRADTLAESVSFENTRAMPRAWLAAQVRQLDQGDVLRSVHTSRLPDGSSFDPAQTALVEEAISGDDQRAATDARATARELAPGHVEIDTESPAATFCVLSDMFYPGWRATIDGTPSKIFRTDYVLMGVELPAGRHTVVFRYVPTRFYLGALVSGFALLCVIGLVGYSALVVRPQGGWAS
ncbi:MAG TPA: YfhO family protein [Pirellulales bacterium]|nr:YfhO family protein [Pirellulales bacterium]